jgi:hypothetical protein
MALIIVMKAGPDEYAIHSNHIKKSAELSQRRSDKVDAGNCNRGVCRQL